LAKRRNLCAGKTIFLAFEPRLNLSFSMNLKTLFLPFAAVACLALATVATAQTSSPTNVPARAPRAPTLPGPPPGDTTIVTLPFTEDFESGKIDTNIWDFRVHGDATVKVAQDNVAHGKNALLVHYPTGARGAYAFIAARLPEAVHDHLYGRAYVYIKWIPAGHMVLMNAGTRGFPISNFLEIGQSRGQFQPSFQLNGPGPDRGETTARQGDIPMGRWFCLEWEFNDKPDRIVEWVDGQQVVDKSFAYKGVNSGLVKGFSEFDIGFRAWGNASALTNDIDIYYDDIAISDKPIGQLTPVAEPAK
jgi:hypothetical protein